MKKKLFIAVAVAAIVAVLAIIILFFVVDVNSFRGYIETRAEEVLGRDVRLGKLGLSLFPAFGLRVDDVAVAARPGEGEDDLLSLRSLRIGARLMPLLSKRLEVTSIVLVEPSVNLVRDADGSWNFDLGAVDETDETGGPTTGSEGPPELTIDSLRITGGRVAVRDAARSPGHPTEIALTDLELELSGFQSSGEFRVAVESGSLSLTDPALGSSPVELEIGEVDLAVRNGGDQVELTNLEIVVGGTALILTGGIETQADDRRIDLDLKPTSIDPVDLSSLLATAGDLGLKLTGKEPVVLEAGVHGVLGQNRLPEIDARVTVEGVTLETASLTQPVTDIQAVATLRGTTVSVDGLRMNAGDNDVSGTLELVVGDRPTLDFALESQNADLGELLGLLAASEEDDGGNAAPPDPDSFLMRGVADGTLKVAEGSWISLRFRDLDARLRLSKGVATLEPVSMDLYDGHFTGSLVSDLTRVPQSFEFSGEADGIDMDPFIADQMGVGDILFGRFTGRVEGHGTGTDPSTVLRSLDGKGIARIIDGQVGRLDVLRSLGEVAGVLGQRTLANLASESATGATKFSQLGGDFRMGGGELSFDSVLLQSNAFDLSGTGTIDLLSSVMDGVFQIQFSPEVSSWMKQESSRAAELFWDSKSGRVVLPLGLSGPLDGVGASIDWSAAVEDVARRTVERELTNLLGDVLGGSDDDKPDRDSATSPDTGTSASARQPATATRSGSRRAEAPSGRFAIEVTKTEWGGSFFAQDFKIQCRVSGEGVEHATMTAVEAGGKEVGSTAVDLASRLADATEASFEVRVDGKRLLLAGFPVAVTVSATAGDGEAAEVVVVIEEAGR